MYVWKFLPCNSPKTTIPDDKMSLFRSCLKMFFLRARSVAFYSCTCKRSLLESLRNDELLYSSCTNIRHSNLIYKCHTIVAKKNPGILKYFTKYLARQKTIYFSNSGTYKKMVGAQVIFDRNVVQMVIMPL